MQFMTTETTFRLAFLILLAALFAMRFYFMIRVRRSGGRIMPDEGAIKREGGQDEYKRYMQRTGRFFPEL